MNLGYFSVALIAIPPFLGFRAIIQSNFHFVYSLAAEIAKARKKTQVPTSVYVTMYICVFINVINSTNSECMSGI